MTHDRFIPRCLLTTTAALVAMLTLAGCPGGKKGTDSATSEKVRLEFFVMSQCPYGKQVEDLIDPILKKMGGNIDFSIDFIGREKGGKLVSMHGENEVNGDKVQLCTAKYFPQKLMDVVSCMNKNPRAIPGNWEECFRQAKLQPEKVRVCYKGREGTDLLRASFERARKRGARGSPTIFVAGKSFRGKRTRVDFTRAICAAFTEGKPQLCADIPAPPPTVRVPVTILTDKRCRACNADLWKKRITGLFPGAEVEVLDYNNAAGKKLYADLGLKLLPAVLFAKEVKKTQGYNRVSRGLTPRGDYLSLRVGAKFDPTREICDNGTDDTNNGKIDCGDPDCADDLACRKEIPKKLDVFVMGQCPFGVKALDSMREVLDNFKNGIRFDIHYIATAKGDGFVSLHKQPEVDEDIRELCAIKHYGKNYKYMDYILCRNKNIHSTDWQSCTGKNGIGTRLIEKCAGGKEGKNLLREDIRLAQALGIGASPTWLANNKFKFSGIDAETIKRNICRYNKGLVNCDKKLSGPPKRKAGGSCNCGGGGSCGK